MRLMTKCPVCVTAHEYALVPDPKFNIKKYKNPDLVLIPDNKKYHISRIFLFDGMQQIDDCRDAIHKIRVKNSIFVRNPILDYIKETDIERAKDSKYLNRLEVLFDNYTFSDIIRLARFIQEKIDFSNTLSGYIVVTIDDIDCTVLNNNIDCNYYTIKICYYETKINGMFTSPDNCKYDSTFDDFVFFTLTHPYNFSPHEFIPIVSYKFINFGDDSNSNIFNFDEETREKLDSDEYFTDISKYAYKYIMKLNKRRNDKEYKGDLNDSNFIYSNPSNEDLMIN